MALHQVLECAGLCTADNEISAVPKGALLRATNTVIRSKNILEQRRGQKYLGQNTGTSAAATFGTSFDNSKVGTFFGTDLIIQYTTKLSRYTGGAFVDYSGSYTEPDSELLRMKFLEFAQSLYFTSNVGLYVLETAAGTPAAAGVPRAWTPDRDNSGLDGDPGDGWMSEDSAVAHRVLFGRKDAHDRILLGAPSGRFITRCPADFSAAIGGVTYDAVGNIHVTQTAHGYNDGDTFDISPGETGIPSGTKTVSTAFAGITADRFYWSDTGTGGGGVSTLVQNFTQDGKNVALRVPLPPGITTSHFLQVFRSRESVGFDVDPDDELFLVKELAITSSDVTAGYIDLVDDTPEELLDVGGPLYTNENTGDGALQANDAPPLAKDICEWDGRAWFANTTELQRFELSLIGVGSPDGVQLNDTITINGTAFTAKYSPAAATHFLIYEAGTPSVNIERTAQNLVNTLNANHATTGLVAYYVSGDQDMPGKIVLEAKSLSASAFSVYASRPASWGPALTTSSSGAKTSTNDRRKNGLACSKPGQPEAVPLTNRFSVGAANWELQRAVPLKDKLFCFPEVGGIWTVTGSYPDYRVEQVDKSATLIAPELVAVHNNQIFALTSQGVVAISDAGSRIVSQGVEGEIFDLVATAGYANLRTAAFAVSYESDRQVQFWLPTNDQDSYASRGYVFNGLGEEWTVWTGARTWGAVRPFHDLLHMGDGLKNSVRQERKGRTRRDYADEQLPVTISSMSGTAVTLASATGVSAGDVLFQGSLAAVITAVDGNTVTIHAATAFSDAAAHVFVGITNSVQYAAAVPGGAGVLKHWQDLILHWRRFFCREMTVKTESEIDSTEQTRLVGTSAYQAPTDINVGPISGTLKPQNIRVQVPQEHVECSRLRVGFSIREAWCVWALDGHAVTHEKISEVVSG